MPTARKRSMTGWARVVETRRWADVNVPIEDITVGTPTEAAILTAAANDVSCKETDNFLGYYIAHNLELVRVSFIYLNDILILMLFREKNG
jgi:hypothetical protein